MRFALDLSADQKRCIRIAMHPDMIPVMLQHVPHLAADHPGDFEHGSRGEQVPAGFRIVRVITAWVVPRLPADRIVMTRLPGSSNIDIFRTLAI